MTDAEPQFIIYLALIVVTVQHLSQSPLKICALLNTVTLLIVHSHISQYLDGRN